MKYLSTRDKTLRLDAAEAILTGLSRDGGLLTQQRLHKYISIHLTRSTGKADLTQSATMQRLLQSAPKES